MLRVLHLHHELRLNTVPRARGNAFSAWRWKVRITPMSGIEKDPGFFEATIWSTIQKAKHGDEAVRTGALERLLLRYRTPIYSHILASQRCSPERAEDLTQEFIYHALRLDFLRQVGPENGRFRTFIKACVKNFLRDQHVRDSAAKRGGGAVVASLDETNEEGDRVLDPSSPGNPPDQAMDREWAQNVVVRSLEELERECISSRRGNLYQALKGHLGRAPDPGTAAQIGARLGMSEGAVNTAMNRLRGRLGELIAEEVRQTVGAQDDWRAELKYLISLAG